MTCEHVILCDVLVIVGQGRIALSYDVCFRGPPKTTHDNEDFWLKVRPPKLLQWWCRSDSADDAADHIYHNRAT